LYKAYTDVLTRDHLDDFHRQLWTDTTDDMKLNHVMVATYFLVAIVVVSLSFTYYSVSQKKSPPCGFLTFFPNGWEFLINFYPRDAMLAWVIEIATCPSVRLSRAGIVSKRRKLAA